jgi:hypothetical protein
MKSFIVSSALPLENDHPTPSRWNLGWFSKPPVTIRRSKTLNEMSGLVSSFSTRLVEIRECNRTRRNVILFHAWLCYIYWKILEQRIYFLASIALSNSVPIADSAWWSTTSRSSVMDTSIILASRCTTSCASTRITVHISTNTSIRATLVGRTRLEWSTGRTTIFPITTFQLIVTARIIINIPFTAELFTAWFHFTNTRKTLVINVDCDDRDD